MEIVTKCSIRKIILIRVGHKFKNRIKFIQILNFQISTVAIKIKVNSLKDNIFKTLKIKYIKTKFNKIQLVTFFSLLMKTKEYIKMNNKLILETLIMAIIIIIHN